MSMSKVLPDYGYLIGLNGEIVPGDEESEYIERYLPVCLLHYVITESAKCLKHLLDSSNNDKNQLKPNKIRYIIFLPII